MITLIFTNGQRIKTRCKNPGAAISKAQQVSPLMGTIAGTLLEKDGKVFGVITGPILGWESIQDTLARRPGNIGQLEQLAGLQQDQAARFAFWSECDTAAGGAAGGAAVFAIAVRRCHDMIVTRLKRGELCLL